MRTGKQGGNLDNEKRVTHKEQRSKTFAAPKKARDLGDLEELEDNGSPDLGDLEELEDGGIRDLGDLEELEDNGIPDLSALEDMEDLGFDSEEEAEEEWSEGEEWEEEEPVKAWKTALVFLGLIAAAAIICAVLWHFSHGDKPENDGMAGQGQVSAPGNRETDSEESGNLSDPQDSDPVSSGEDEIQGGEDGDLPVTEPISGTKDMEFTAVEQSVTPKDVVNLRSVPTTLDTDNVVTQVQNGEVLVRTGINEDTGWSEIEYQGEKLYAVSQFLTLDLNYKPSMEVSNPNRVSTIDGRIIIFADCDDWITPKEYVNLRTEPSTSEGNETVSCQLNNGEKAHRTGFSPDSGWSRVEYNGQVLYVVTSLISTIEE